MGLLEVRRRTQDEGSLWPDPDGFLETFKNLWRIWPSERYIVVPVFIGALLATPLVELLLRIEYRTGWRIFKR